MLVSAISSSSYKTVFNTRVSNRNEENNTEITTTTQKIYSKNIANDSKKELFDSINEWKYFCHSQIEKGNFDIIL